MEIGCLGRLHGATFILTAILEDTANPSWNDFYLNYVNQNNNYVNTLSGLIFTNYQAYLNYVNSNNNYVNTLSGLIFTNYQSYMNFINSNSQYNSSISGIIFSNQQMYLNYVVAEN